MARHFRSTRHGLVVSLDEPELRLLQQLPAELRALLESATDRVEPKDAFDAPDAPDAPDDPVLQRLFPRAYLDPTEEKAEQEWQGLVHPELLNDRLAALALVTAGLERATEKRNRFEVLLPEDEAQAWLGVINDARLALGTRLAITEETDIDAIDPDDPVAPAFAIYGWLTWFQGELVETLLG